MRSSDRSCCDDRLNPPIPNRALRDWGACRALSNEGTGLRGLGRADEAAVRAGPDDKELLVVEDLERQTVATRRAGHGVCGRLTHAPTLEVPSPPPDRSVGAGRGTDDGDLDVGALRAANQRFLAALIRVRAHARPSSTCEAATTVVRAAFHVAGPSALPVPRPGAHREQIQYPPGDPESASSARFSVRAAQSVPFPLTCLRPSRAHCPPRHMRRSHRDGWTVEAGQPPRRIQPTPPSAPWS